MAEEKKTTLEKAAEEYEKEHTYQRYDGGGLTPEYEATLAEAFIAGAEWQKEQMLRIAKDRYELAMTFVTGNSEVDQALQMDRLALVKIIEEGKK